MKRIFTSIIALFFAFNAFSQAPEKMSYQAVVRNSDNTLVSSQAVGIQISILQSSASGTAVYVETQTPSTNASGLLSIEVGAGTVVSGTFAGIDWSADTYFIKTEIDPAGGTAYSITGVSQMLSVPYALYAKNVETYDETDPIYASSEAVNITAPDITNLGNLSGVNTGDQDLSTLATKVALEDTAAQLRTEILDNKVSVAYVDALEAKLESYMLAAGVWDIDGNHYNVVKINDQIWMAENLKTTRYADGTPIPNVSDSATYSVLPLDEKAYTWYENDEATYKDLYGALYSWAGAVNGADSSNLVPSGVQGVCPDGWHIPSDKEWQALERFLGMNAADLNLFAYRGTTEGGKLKSIGTSIWQTPNTGATNEVGFNALPSGQNWNGEYQTSGTFGFWWSSTATENTTAVYRSLAYDRETIYRNRPVRRTGMSVRCVKD